MTLIDSVKLVCQECDWCGPRGDRLVASNPFDSIMAVYGCPACKAVNCFRVACDEDGCWELVTCGTPTDDGYRSTCSKHRPGKAAEAAGGGG